MGRQGQKVDAEVIDIDGDRTYGLHGIGMKGDFVLLGEPSNLPNGLQSTGLVIGMHDGDEDGVGADSG